MFFLRKDMLNSKIILQLIKHQKKENVELQLIQLTLNIVLTNVTTHTLTVQDTLIMLKT